ncbi:MAG: phosphatidylglycerol lysyltransferase domain-containing protein [Candidatus Melainabacteria bacterium]|nr:phosphatidylglycerol lysyltransferase domain-containing protein [Candidatus Melainabacteria bacterium]
MDRNEEIIEETDLDDRPDVDYQDSSNIPQTPPDLTAAQKRQLTHARWPVNLVATFTLLSGLIGTIQPLAARMHGHPKIFAAVIPYDYYHFGKSLHVAFGLFLIYLSLNLFKRKRSAWLAALILSLLSAILHAAQVGAERFNWIADRSFNETIPLVAVIIPTLTVVLLFLYRSQFSVKSQRPSLRVGLRRLALSLILVLTYGTLGFWLLQRRDFGLNFEIGEAFLRTLRETFFLGNPDLVPHSKFGIWFINSLHLFGTIATVVAAYGLFRPIQYQLSTQPRERERVLQLLKKHGKDALDNYKTLPDKSYFFLENGASVIAYKTVLNIAIGLGDPVGPDHEMEKVTIEFRKFCHNNDWKLAFLQVKPDNIDLYKRLGLDVLKVGEEAIIDLEKFANETIKGKNFKSKLKKFDKEGFILERQTAPHTKELLDTVESVSNQWLSLPGRRERGFSLGWFDRESLVHETLFILKDPKGEVIAFVNQVPSYAPGEASIDMMRHKEDVPNGTMDFLFTKLLVALKDNGFKTFNLGLAALSGVGDQPDASLEERAIHQIYEHMNRFFSYKGLRQYKNKFGPIWKASYLVTEGGAPGLIKTALAITRAGELSLDDDDE